jgi:hypothetical protein
MKNITDKLIVISIIWIGVEFTETEILDLMCFLDENDFSKYHPQFLKEFYKLVNFIYQSNHSISCWN